MNTSGRDNTNWGCFGPNFGRGVAYTASLPTLVGGCSAKFSHNLSSWFMASTPEKIEGAILCGSLRLSNPSSPDEELGPPHPQACSVFTLQDIKAEADSKAGPVGSNRGEPVSKHDFVMVRGSAPPTPKSTPEQEAGKTYYGGICGNS
jgi:hypothetical protein